MPSGRPYHASLTHWAAVLKAAAVLHPASGCVRLVFLFYPLVEESSNAVLRRLVKGYVGQLQHQRHPALDNHEATLNVRHYLLHSVCHVAAEGVQHKHARGLPSAVLLAACTTPAKTIQAQFPH